MNFLFHAHILLGQTCSELGIPVELRAPSIMDADMFDSTFITSTSRLVLPVDELTLEAHPKVDVLRTLKARDHAVTFAIRDQVLKNIRAASEKIL